jgi:hypothetical protein
MKIRTDLTPRRIKILCGEFGGNPSNSMSDNASKCRGQRGLLLLGLRGKLSPETILIITTEARTNNNNRCKEVIRNVMRN